VIQPWTSGCRRDELEEARNSAGEFIGTQERRFIEQADRLVDLIYNEDHHLDTAAENRDSVQEAGPLHSRAGGDGIAATPACVAAAFSTWVLEQASASDPVELGENHVVGSPQRPWPKRQLPLADVRDQVIAGVRREGHGAGGRESESLNEQVKVADPPTLASGS
jgi:peptidyl-prolyl cis-trans isomerase D